jgi:hypothetical protein
VTIPLFARLPLEEISSGLFFTSGWRARQSAADVFLEGRCMTASKRDLDHDVNYAFPVA